MSDAPTSTPSSPHPPEQPQSSTPPANQVTFTVYQGPPLQTVRNIVASHFLVKDAFVDPYGIPTIHVAAEPPREKFKRLLLALGQQGLIAALRGSGDTLTIRVFQKPHLKPSVKLINLVLFIVTIATVFASGYFLWTAVGDQQLTFQSIVEPGANPFLKAAMFAVGLLSIIGLHEFGHKAAANYHRLDATLPYFIPGPPPIGTFGALISLRGPPANRDQLFDLGISGPVVGFIVTILVAFLSIAFGTPIDTARADLLSRSGLTLSTIDWNSWVPRCLGTGGCEPAILILVSSLAGLFIQTAPQGILIINSQLWFAARIGALITFLNIVPAWQLDGGHISRAVYGPDGHRIATIVGLLILFVLGYYPFAFLLLFMMSFSRRGTGGVEPLDDVSRLGNSRKILYLLALLMLVLTFFPAF